MLKGTFKKKVLCLLKAPDKLRLVFLMNFTVLWFYLHKGDIERTKILSSSVSEQFQFKNGSL